MGDEGHRVDVFAELFESPGSKRVFVAGAGATEGKQVDEILKKLQVAWPEWQIHVVLTQEERQTRKERETYL